MNLAKLGARHGAEAEGAQESEVTWEERRKRQKRKLPKVERRISRGERFLRGWWLRRRKRRPRRMRKKRERTAKSREFVMRRD